MNTGKIKGANLSNFIPLITILADTKNRGYEKKEREGEFSFSVSLPLSLMEQRKG